ncbi:RNA polymerase sigma-70 factor [Alistipes sp. OttesenSCG-928-B03]|nr:RNA polymerase sigma-70 factor [Alistipes sp. OttesenSCG-928-B03]
MKKEIRGFLDGINNKAEKAWEKLYGDYYAPLCNYALRIVGDGQTSEDVVQASLIKIWEMPLSFGDLPSLNVYLYRAVFNNCLKHIRDKDRDNKRLREWAEEPEEPDNEAVRAMVTEEAVRKLRSLIDAMPPKRREVMLLSIKDMKVEEIAERLRISPNTVKKHKKAAYSAIRAAVKSDFLLLSVLV